MKVISVETMRALDAQAIAAGTSGYALMERAGEGACLEILRFLARRYSPAHCARFLVLAGKGNNGGDAYVVARCLAERGHPVTVYAVCPPSSLSGDAHAHAQRLPPSVSVHGIEELRGDALSRGTVVVDGLLGTGISGPVRPAYDHVISQVNASRLPVVALDVPSGLDGDSGIAAGNAVRADLTVTMAQPKQGLLSPEGLMCCGCLRRVDIGIPEAYVADAQGWRAEATMVEDAEGLVTRRPRDGHKGTFGHVLVVGGSVDYGGAPFLAGEGALRAGAGLVTVAVPKGCAPLCRVSASLIVRRVAGDGNGFLGEASCGALSNLASGCSALVFGPGTGAATGPGFVLEHLMSSDLPMVVDADGLRRLARVPRATELRRAPTVLTPHPGEMQVLLQGYDCASARDQGRLEQTAALAAASGCVVVLKGMGTVVGLPDGRLAVNTSGSPALATAGTGDVLAGIIGALLGQGLSGWDAARLGVFVHGLAADVRGGAERAMTADDLLTGLKQAWREISPAA